MSINAKRESLAHQNQKETSRDEEDPASGEKKPEQADSERITLLERSDARHDAAARRQLLAIRSLAGRSKEARS